MSTDGQIDQGLETELLRQIGAGDPDSFEDLYDRFSGSFFGGTPNPERSKRRGRCLTGCLYPNLG